MYLIVFTVALV